MAKKKKAVKKVVKPRDEFTPEQRASFVIQPEDAVRSDAPVYEIARSANKEKEAK